jgi:hypothetical protein
VCAWGFIASFQDKGPFTLGVKNKEPQESSDPIGRELKIGSKGFILGIKTKVHQNDLAPIWHCFGAKFPRPKPNKICQIKFSNQILLLEPRCIYNIFEAFSLTPKVL